MAKSKRSTKKTEKSVEVQNEPLVEAADNSIENLTQILKPSIFLQFSGKEYNQEDIIEQIKEIWQKEEEKDSEIISMEVYIKPEESSAYFVINNTYNGKIAL